MREELRTKTQKIVMAGLFAALIFTATTFLRIAGLGGEGYVHLGDLFIFLACYYLGGWYAIAATVVGSALADLVGYPLYIPATVIVKGLMAAAVVFIGGDFKNKKRMAVAFTAGAVVMIVGYFLAEFLMYGFIIPITDADNTLSNAMFGFVTALAGVLGNVLQGVAGVALACTVIMFANRARFFQSEISENKQ